jgi:CRP/FNR family transcriptional regulator, cyclic AMP receptor protein
MRSSSPLAGTPLTNSRLGLSGRTILFRRRETIFSVGDASEYIFLIESGSAKLTLTSVEGREAVIGVLHEGDFFGETALDVDRRPRATSAIALTDLRVMKIGRETMLHLLRNDDDISRAFIAYLIRLVAQLTTNIGDRLLYGGEQRLARALLSVARMSAEDECKCVPELTQQDLANMIGITRQRVNALMKRFRSLGFIDYADGLRVHSSLREAAQKPHRHTQ